MIQCRIRPLEHIFNRGVVRQQDGHADTDLEMKRDFLSVDRCLSQHQPKPLGHLHGAVLVSLSQHSPELPAAQAPKDIDLPERGEADRCNDPLSWLIRPHLPLKKQRSGRPTRTDARIVT